MIQHLTTQRVTEPTVYVTKGRQRVKQYNNTIYLKNGDEFEIELFNPTSNKILAKITLNGKSLGAGMVIRPGERVFLERYFDEAKKFLFETYVVDGADYNAQQAIKMNGIVEVEFYDQHTPIVYVQQPVTYQTVTTWPPYNGGTYYNCTSGSRGSIGSSGVAAPSACYTAQNKTYVDGPILGSANVFTCSTGSVGLGTVTPTSSLTIGNAACDFSADFNQSFSAPVQSVETGRVEKGSNSDQGFITDSTSFNSYYSWRTAWTILPESQRPVVIEDLNVYCTNCGAKRKKSNHKFCPNCGGKF